MKFRRTSLGLTPVADLDGTRRLTDWKRADGGYERVYMRRATAADVDKVKIEGEWWTPVEGLARIVMPKGWEP